MIKALNLLSISFFVTKSSREINDSVLWISANLFLLLVLEQFVLNVVEKVCYRVSTYFLNG